MKFCLLAGSLMQHQTAWQWIRVKIIELNLFKTPTMRTDPFERSTLRISTWIYLVVLCLSMIIIVLFTWLTVRIESKTVENLTLAKFEELQKQYPTSLQCPCSQITIPHDSFISIFPQFHPVCTSWFISDQWINAMWSSSRSSYELIYKDIFQVGPKFFISLKSFCELMRTIVSDASFIFNQSLLITDQVLSYVEFTARAQQILNQFTLNTVAESKRSLALIRSQTATIYTTGETDVSWHKSSYSSYFQAVANEIGNCSCGLNDDCKQQLGFYDFNEHLDGLIRVLFYIPNMFSSCFTIQSLLQSSLECFFDQKCANPVIQRASLFVEKNDEIWINSSILQINSTRFSPNLPVEEIINEMMIEKWGDNINYSNYYEQCEPKLCTYFFTSRNNALYVFTTMIGLFGGLSVAFRIIIPLIVTWIRNRIYRRVETGNCNSKNIIV
jgi:hypothetical protein